MQLVERIDFTKAPRCWGADPTQDGVPVVVCRQNSVGQQIQAINAGAGTRARCYKSGPMIPSFIGFLTCLSALFRSR